jgi:hypothetical protein
MNRWDKIQQSINEFQNQLNSSVPNLKIIQATDKKWTKAEYQSNKPVGFPFKMAGVYLLFNTDDELLYIGVSTVCFNKRIWHHDNRLKSRRFIDIIPFEDKFIHFAPALEYFLITRHHTPGNKTYKNHGF